MRLKKMSDYILKLFDSPPGSRLERDINAIVPILLMKTRCFRNISNETLAYILQHAKLERYKEDDVIVKQGDVGETFYVIIKGSVSVYLDPKQDSKTIISEDNPSFPFPPPRRMSILTDSDKEGPSQEAVQEKKSASSRSRRESISTAQRPESKRHRRSSVRRQSIQFAKDSKDKKEEKKIRRKYGQCVNTLGQYQSFGELALIYPNRQRNASAIAEDNTEVMVISYEIFEKTLQDTLEQDLDEKRLFIQTHPFFSQWNIPLQRQLQWSLVRTEHKIGDHAIKQGDNVSGLHFLIRGRARLAAEPVRHRILFPELFVRPKKSVFEKEEPQILVREETSVSQLADNIRISKTRKHILAGMDPLTYIRRTDGYAAAEKIVLDKMVDLCNVEEGEVINDFELLLGLEKNIFSVICTSACTFFHLDAKIFDRLIYKKNTHTLSMMKFLAERKLTQRMSSQQGHKMPILSPLLLQILEIRVVEPSEEKGDGDKVKTSQSAPTKSTESVPKLPKVPKLERAKTVLIDWFVHGKTPLLQPINKDAILYRDMIQKRAKFRENLRERGPKEFREVKSLGRRIKDSYWFNLREKRKAVNTMKRLKLQNSETTAAARWK